MSWFKRRETRCRPTDSIDSRAAEARDRWLAINAEAKVAGCKCGTPATHVRRYGGTLGGVPYEVWTCEAHKKRRPMVQGGEWAMDSDGWHHPGERKVESRMSRPVFHDGKVHVMDEMCATCVFRPGNLMNLRPGRLKEMVDDSVLEGGGITCHSTIYGQAEQEATCRGFFDAHKDRVPALSLADLTGRIEEVSGNKEEE